MYNFNQQLKRWQEHWFTRDIPIKESYLGPVMITELYGIRGFLVPGDVLFLWHIGLNLPEGGKYLEIGSWMGLSAVAVAFGLISNSNFGASVYCVDPWEVMPEQQNYGFELQNRDLYELFLENMEKAKVSRFVKPFRGKSIDISSKFSDEEFDAIFIDGEHSFTACYEDLNAWYPKLKKQGVLIGHDASPGSGVVKALDKFCSEKNLQYTVIPNPYTNSIWQIK